jgi:hypothetical protein
MITKKGGIIIGASKGKVAWDDMIQTLCGQYLDYSIVDINAHQ